MYDYITIWAVVSFRSTVTNVQDSFNGLHYLFSITVMQGFKTSRYKSCRKNLLVQSFCLVPLLIHTLLKGQIQFTSLAGILYMKPYELLQSRSAMMVLSIE